MLASFLWPHDDSLHFRIACFHPFPSEGQLARRINIIQCHTQHLQPQFTLPRLISTSHKQQKQWNIKEKIKSLINAYSDNHLLARVDDTDSLVLAGGADKATVAVPAHAVNDIRVHVLQGNHSLTCAHVPDDDLVVAT